MIDNKLSSLATAIVAYKDIITANKQMVDSINSQFIQVEKHIIDLEKTLLVIQLEFDKYKASMNTSDNNLENKGSSIVPIVDKLDNIQDISKANK